MPIVVTSILRAGVVTPELGLKCVEYNLTMIFCLDAKTSCPKVSTLGEWLGFGLLALDVDSLCFVFFPCRGACELRMLEASLWAQP